MPTWAPHERTPAMFRTLAHVIVELAFIGSIPAIVAYCAHDYSRTR